MNRHYLRRNGVHWEHVTTPLCLIAQCQPGQWTLPSIVQQSGYIKSNDATDKFTLRQDFKRYRGISAFFIRTEKTWWCDTPSWLFALLLAFQVRFMHCSVI